ncbi:MAG: tRNA (adenosine(37)-N6)-dimethylallyltransferase MiaA [Acidimicrobiia bacterium]|nr:tRNA (adenosine(37)-N6)-dimethylallyltransferase MiaA [Acidimicrobiia bacterium]
MVVGPTAAGKSEVALQVAERLGGIVVSLDSMQVYRGMDIGTAKPTPADRARVPHAMIDLVEPSEEYTVRQFQTEARRLIDEADGPVVLAGGSGLHMRAVIDPMEFLPTDPDLRSQLEASELEPLVEELVAADPEAGTHVDLANQRRVVRAVEVLRLSGRTPSVIAADPSRRAVSEYESLYPCRIFGIDPGEDLPGRIEQRIQAMIDRGLMDEVAGLRGRLGRTAGQAVGYAQLMPVVTGEMSLADGVAATRKATWELARRQRAWFRRDPRVRWLDPLQTDAVAAVMEAT